MTEKSFRQILEENMTSNKGPEITATRQSEGPSFEIPFWPDFRLHTKAAPTADLSTLYPAAPRAKVARSIPKDLVDQWLETKGLNASELAAIHLLKLEITEGKLALRAVKKMYRQEILRLHPDRHPKNISKVETEKLLAAFRDVRAAYQVLQAAFANVNKSGEARPKS